MSHQQVLEGIGVLSCLMPFVAGICARRRLNEPAFRVFGTFVVLQLLLSICIWIAGMAGNQVVVLQMVMLPVAFLLILAYYYLLYPSKTVQWLLGSLVLAFILLSAVVMVYTASWTEAYYRLSFVTLALMSVPAVYFLYKLLTHPGKRELWYCHVIIHVGLLVYSVGNAIALSLALYFEKYLEPLLINVRFAMWGIHILLIIIVNLLYTFAFICQSRK